MKCKICHRDMMEEGFCSYHAKAHKVVVNKFNAWATALDVSWEQYLMEIQKNSLTGLWAKDVAKYLMQEEQKRCLTK